jgi:hypothetical protein
MDAEACTSRSTTDRTSLCRLDGEVHGNRALVTGQTAGEIEPDGKAAAEAVSEARL